MVSHPAMDALLGLLVLLVIAVPIAISVRRSTELFVLKIERGQIELVRGRVPHGLFNDLADVLKGTHSNGRVVVAVDHREAVIRTKGTFSEGTLQRMRNVVGAYPLAKIRAGGRVAR